MTASQGYKIWSDNFAISRAWRISLSQYNMTKRSGEFKKRTALIEDEHFNQWLEVYQHIMSVRGAVKQDVKENAIKGDDDFVEEIIANFEAYIGGFA